MDAMKRNSADFGGCAPERATNGRPCRRERRAVRKVCRAVIILAAVLIYCWVGRMESFMCSIGEGVIVICALLAVALAAWRIGIKEEYR